MVVVVWKVFKMVLPKVRLEFPSWVIASSVLMLLSKRSRTPAVVDLGIGLYVFFF